MHKSKRDKRYPFLNKSCSCIVDVKIRYSNIFLETSCYCGFNIEQESCDWILPYIKIVIPSL
jgi:hypothetical protein